MKNLSRILLPDNFEQEIFVRSLLSKLETPTIPPGFDGDVLRSVKKRSPLVWVYISAGISVIITAFLLWWNSAPNVVRVANVPTISPYQINVEHLPPAPIYKYTVVERSSRVPVVKIKIKNGVKQGKAVAGY